MELIRTLGRRLNKSGNSYQSYAIFWCDGCSQEVERQISNGLKANSCGCQRSVLLSSKLKGLKRTEISRKKQGKTTKGHIVTNEVRLKISNSLKGHSVSKETKLSISKANKGKNKGILNGNWNDGSSFEEYPPEFNKELKQFILERDDYKCQYPGCIEIHNQLQIHHIDFNKQNNVIENLIALGTSCHVKTNYNRKYWTEFYQNITMYRIMECLL